METFTEKEVLKFVIIGHVDHGKSTLIGRLLYDTNSLPTDRIEEIRKTSHNLGRETEFAYLLDHLEEERQQGITIDTTQVFFKLDKREYVIIDAPGHVEFVKNMITGASQAEAALLIIDSALGIQEQTKRHATIISLLGIQQLIVLINKMDLVNFREQIYLDLKNQTENFLRSFHITAQGYIPISALKGDNVVFSSTNLPWYKGPTVLGALDFLKNKLSNEEQTLIFPIQDIYKVDSQRLAVGRVESGKLQKGQMIKILPDARATTIKSIEKFLEQPQVCSAGENVGITTEDSVFLERGNVLCDFNREIATGNVFQANVFWMDRQEYLKPEKLILRIYTQETTCKIEQIKRRINSSSLEVIENDAEIIKNLEIGEVVIKTKKPIVIQKFKDVQEMGRFVLVRNDNICAGGIITGIEDNKNA